MKSHVWLLALTALPVGTVATPAFSQAPESLANTWDSAASKKPATSADAEAIIVTGSRISQLGIAESANAGVVTTAQLAARTVYRPGELLEVTPGLIVSQHSGEGKANQFYLRGFNLDHGTDLRTTIDGMLVNQRSHAHGQG